MVAVYPSSNQGIEASNQVERERREGNREIDRSAMQYMEYKNSLEFKNTIITAYGIGAVRWCKTHCAVT